MKSIVKVACVSLICVSMLSASSLLLGTFAVAGDADWSQWRGPNRDGHAAPQELKKSWDDDAPQLRWSFTSAGRGYSAVSVVDGRLYTMGTHDDKCFAICIDAQTGAPIWETEVARAGTADDYNHGWGGGPRSTPTVDGDQVIVLSDIGQLAALSKSNGDVQWTTNFVADHAGKIPVWGYSESPLVDGDRVVVTPGEANFMVALDRKTGEKVWSSQGVNAPAQYNSVIKGKLGDQSFYVNASKPGLFAFDTKSGQEVFSDTTTGNTVAVIPTAILSEDLLYHTSDYGAGNTLLKLKPNAAGDGIDAESIYHLAGKSMMNHHGGVVLHEGVIYGCTKANGGMWMAQDLQSGETLWEKKARPNHSGSICFADGMLYCYNDEEGSVNLVQPSREAWTEKGTLTLPRETELPRDKGAIWAHPVVADQMLIIRDQDLIFAFDIAR
ncbi:outer membrane biogenesis protein BamB [Novipirellula galeiformis]|uniref:Outer membrane biogenesis protein BamB n=1 Tax=Novipirellula galeiformis TaxID=2528004 RepID=A0A5C6CPY6_9BACT|nr:PQQ-binding-like beta-propeller repeat protein [Novipirellula galeiformis]TWU26542.1 outer membrane biogenesis protein BamB [Novipirellula galeiformis]